MDQVDPTASATPEAATSFELTKFERCRVAFRTLLSRAHFRSGESSRRTCIFAGVHLVDVQPSGGFRLWCKFNDGMEGVVDLSDIAADRYCRKWETEPGFFESVVIDGGALRWDEYIDVCYDSVRARLLGLPKEAELDEIWGHRPRVPGTPSVVFAKAMDGFRVGCVFSDGTKGIADFAAWSMNGKFERWRTEEGFFGTVKAKGWGLVWDEWVEITADCVYERIVGRRGRDGSA